MGTRTNKTTEERKKSFPAVERRKRTWCVTDLVVRNGKLCEALLWSNLGKFAALCSFIYNVHKGTDTEWLWFIVMGILTAHEAYTRLIDRKQ
jgi:hypothetical protein